MQPYGTLIANGSFNGYLGHVERGEVDTSAADITPSAQRLHYFDFCYPWARNGHVVVSGLRRNETLMESAFDLLGTFSMHLWLLIIWTLVALFVTQLLASCIDWRIRIALRRTPWGTRDSVTVDDNSARKPAFTFNILFVVGALFSVLFQVSTMEIFIVQYRCHRICTRAI